MIRTGFRATMLATALSLGALGAGAPAFAAGEPMVGGAPMYPNKTVVENASQAKNLTTLVAAVKAAGLVETLSGPGPFTVFAPTDDAFAKIDPATIEKLKTDAPLLTSILTYHVVPGQASPDMVAGEHKTVQGAPVTVAGAGTSVLAPVLYSAVGARAPAGREGADLATVTALGYLGFVAGPPTVGVLSAATSLPVALGSLAAIGVAIAVLGPLVLPRGDRRPAAQTYSERGTGKPLNGAA